MAVEITISIPDQYVSRVLEALLGLSGKTIELMVHGDDFHGDWRYSYSPKLPNETNKQFAERVVRENIKALVKLFDYAEDIERYNAEVALITSPVQDVPDDIIT